MIVAEKYKMSQAKQVIYCHHLVFHEEKIEHQPPGETRKAKHQPLTLFTGQLFVGDFPGFLLTAVQHPLILHRVEEEVAAW